MISKTLLTVSAFLLCVCAASAAPVPPQSQDAPRPKTETAPPPETLARTYRLDYTLTETEGAKKIDSRQYSVTSGGGTNNGRSWQNHVEIGTRVPAGSKSDGTNQYIDVGTKLTGMIGNRDGAQVLDTILEFSSAASDDGKIDGRPILRTLTITDTIPMLTGKPMTVGTADDPNSGRRFVLEVTVTEIK